jgi:hypothetical protein
MIVNAGSRMSIHLSALKNRPEKQYEQHSNHELTNPKIAGNSSFSLWASCTTHKPHLPHTLNIRLR